MEVPHLYSENFSKVLGGCHSLHRKNSGVYRSKDETLDCTFLKSTTHYIFFFKEKNPKKSNNIKKPFQEPLHSQNNSYKFVSKNCRLKQKRIKKNYLSSLEKPCYSKTHCGPLQGLGSCLALYPSPSKSFGVNV